MSFTFRHVQPDIVMLKAPPPTHTHTQESNYINQTKQMYAYTHIFCHVTYLLDDVTYGQKLKMMKA